MTVEELIKLLEKEDPKTKVVCFNSMEEISDINTWRNSLFRGYVEDYGCGCQEPGSEYNWISEDAATEEHIKTWEKAILL